nr:protein ZNF783-like [Macaca fascicularis]XP_045244116.1 protein ZNF783-like [Macaca fascicularis]
MQTDLQGEAQIRSAEVSLLAIVAAVQVVETKMEPQAAWLQSLEGRTRTAEEKLADCEKVAVKFGNQTVAQAGGQVGHVGDSAVGVRAAAEAAGERAVQQKLLDPVAAPRQQGGGPQGNLYFQVPMTPEDTVGYFSEQQGGGLEDSQKELYKRVVKGSCETLSSLDAGQLETPQEFRPGSSKRQGQVGGASRAHRRPLWHTCAQVRRAGLCLPRPVSLGLRRHGVPRGASQRL